VIHREEERKRVRDLRSIKYSCSEVT
jgi:hypothetical protein